MSISPKAEAQLQRITQAWRAEETEARERFRAQRLTQSLPERVAAGLALTKLQIVDMEAASGGKLRLWLEPVATFDPEEFALRQGSPLTLWVDDIEDTSTTISATLSRITARRLSVYVDVRDLPDWLEAGHFNLDQDERDVTFTRGFKALKQLEGAPTNSPQATLREVAYGPITHAQALDVASSDPITEFLDDALHEAQRRAISQALPKRGDLPPISLIHGPPGTGKTRTLIELIAQAASRGEKILACAASNMATDNVVERLLEHTEIDVVRLGHPARVSEAALQATLDHKLEQHTTYKLTRKWLTEAHSIKRKAWIKFERGAISYRERRDMIQEARRLIGDARAQTRKIERAIVQRAQVICVTATAAQHNTLKEIEFDRVVLDEATQASDPVALIALQRAPHIVLAGDPQQLSPTLLAGTEDVLGTTLFERLQALLPHTSTLLTEQHRMHATLMEFPSLQSYDGLLTAHPDVAGHTLADLGVLDDPMRPGELILIDTAGKGWEEERNETSRSLANPQQAARCAAEARRLLGRGLAPTDLAIISPYSGHLKLLRRLLQEEREAGLEIATVDGFQGREKEAVILDLVRSNDSGELGFLTDLRRINVAITRARRALFIIGDSATLGGHPYYDALMDYIQAYGSWLSAWTDEAPGFELEQE